MSKTYYTYILTTTNNSVLYVGVTNDISRRIIEHLDGKDRFTKKYNVNKLVYYEEYSHVVDAIAREKQLKRWTRAKKNALVENINPKWSELRLS